MPDDIKKFLSEGNQRFLKNRLQNHPKLGAPQDANNLPVCIVVGCSDSRTCAEHIFSQSLGNFFSVRNAGHYVTDEVIASLEFAVQGGIKNIMIYGHSQCGAIQGVISSILDSSKAQTPSLKQLIEKFKPTILEVMKDKTLQGDKLLQACIDRNVHKAKHDILEKSVYLRNLHAKKEITVLTGMYKIETGVVEFFD